MVSAGNRERQSFNTPTLTSKRVSTVSIMALAANPLRRSFTVTNTHASATIYIAFNSAAVANSTCFNIAAGTSFTFSTGTTCPQCSTYAISSATSTYLTFYEG
jgi:hypothetical protein